MLIAAGPYSEFHEPIYESLTLSALISSNFNVKKGTTVKNASNHDWEPQENHTYDLVGGWWVTQYFKGKEQWKPGSLSGDRFHNPTGSSHFEDLQFLHYMVSVIGEKPEETKRKVMVWMEVMYKVASEEACIASDTLARDTLLKEFMPTPSLQPKYKSLYYLLAKDSPFERIDVRRRALGSMFHVIQDSYALGHTQRTLLNKEDKISDNPFRFKKGAADRWGPIENFHTYFGHDDNQHEHYDHANDEILDPNNQAITLMYFIDPF